MRHFDFLRTIPWEPEFVWVDTPEQAARLINVWHNDFPKRVNRTLGVLLYWSLHLKGALEKHQSLPISLPLLKSIHYDIFEDTSHRGEWRDCQVVVGNHHPPSHELVKKFMWELFQKTAITSIEDLIDWNTDFLACHPFEDGNGRVSGVVTGIYSRMLHPEKGWLAPLQ